MIEPAEHPECGYQPVSGGVRHLTWLDVPPATGTIVECLCGKAHQVARRPKANVIYDCSACDAVYREELGLPPHP